jgi:hypothetical protein
MANLFFFGRLKDLEEKVGDGIRVAVMPWWEWKWTGVVVE